MIGSLLQSRRKLPIFLEAFGTARETGSAIQLSLPIYYQVGTLRAEGAWHKLAVGGLYAWAAILRTN